MLKLLHAGKTWQFGWYNANGHRKREQNRLEYQCQTEETYKRRNSHIFGNPYWHRNKWKGWTSSILSLLFLCIVRSFDRLDNSTELTLANRIPALRKTRILFVKIYGFFFLSLQRNSLDFTILGFDPVFSFLSHFLGSIQQISVITFCVRIFRRMDVGFIRVVNRQRDWGEIWRLLSLFIRIAV